MTLYKSKEESWIKLSIIVDLQCVDYSVLLSGSHGDLACVSIYSACRFTVCKPIGIPFLSVPMNRCNQQSLFLDLMP